MRSICCWEPPELLWRGVWVAIVEDALYGLDMRGRGAGAGDGEAVLCASVEPLTEARNCRMGDRDPLPASITRRSCWFFIFDERISSAFLKPCVACINSDFRDVTTPMLWLDVWALAPRWRFAVSTNCWAESHFAFKSPISPFILTIRLLICSVGSSNNPCWRTSLVKSPNVLVVRCIPAAISAVVLWNSDLLERLSGAFFAPFKYSSQKVKETYIEYYRCGGLWQSGDILTKFDSAIAHSTTFLTGLVCIVSLGGSTRSYQPVG